MHIKLDELFQDQHYISQTILNSLAEGVVVANIHGELLYFNDIAEETLGFGLLNIDPEQWSESYGCFDIDKSTPVPSLELPLAKTLSTGQVHSKIVYIQNSRVAMGTFIDIAASPIKDNNENILGGIAVFKNITEQMQAELSLKQSEERLNAQFKGFPIPTYVWRHIGDDFILLNYNNAAYDFTDGGISKLVDKKLSMIYPQNKYQNIHEDFWTSFHYQKCIDREINYKLITNGKQKDLHVFYVFIPPDLIVVHTMDITERKKTEMRLQKLSNAVEQTADAVLITDRSGIIEYVNPAFEGMTGYCPDEVIGETPRILKSGHYDNSFYKELWSTLINGKPFKVEMLNKKKNRDDFWVQNTITPITDQTGQIINFVSVIKDITDIKIKQELQVRLEIAREIQQRFYISDIKIPGYDIAGKCFPADETGGDYFDIIQKSDEHLWLTIADVSNHGIGPALIMAGTRAYLRAFLQASHNPAEIMNKLNNALYHDLDEAKYVTMLLVHLDLNKQTMEYASAGHVPAYLLDKDGHVVHTLESTGIPLGYLEHTDFETGKVDNITAGMMLLLLTDGLIETMDRHENEFGCDNILNLLKKYRHLPAHEIITNLYNQASVFSETSCFDDDITALICKIKSIQPHES